MGRRRGAHPTGAGRYRGASAYSPPGMAIPARAPETVTSLTHTHVAVADCAKRAEALEECAPAKVTAAVVIDTKQRSVRQLAALVARVVPAIVLLRASQECEHAMSPMTLFIAANTWKPMLTG